MEIKGLNALRNVISQLGRGHNLSPFVGFWETMVYEASTSLFEREKVQAESVREALQALLDFLKEGMPAHQVPMLRSKISGATRFTIPIERLPGDTRDPTTPLGLHCLLDPSWSGSDTFTGFFPHTFALLETVLQGPAVVAASVRSASPSASEATMKAGMDLTAKIQEEIGRDHVASLCRLAARAIDEAFLATPFLAFDRPEDFYRHGCRFFGQGELDYYKCGVTSGFVIPEEYYGQRVYETFGPGITKEARLRPGSFDSGAIPTQSAWSELVTASASCKREPYDPLLDHPFRPLYFDSAVERVDHRGGQFHNIVDVERTGLRLRERAEYWEQQGCLDSYLQDAAAILAHFLCSPRVSTYFVRSLDSAWRSRISRSEEPGHSFSQAPIAAPFLASLLSDRVCVYTSRGSLRAISRGFWVNPPVLEYLAASPGTSWEIIPFYLLGLPPSMVQELLRETEDRRTYWLEKYIQTPTRDLFREASRVQLPEGSRTPRHVETLSLRILEELLRPDLDKVLRPERRAFLTLTDLPEVFGRSYARLRHWISDYNLGAYSSQGHEHRFARKNLDAFVVQELAGKRGFSDQRIREIQQAIDRAFDSPQATRSEQT